MLQDLLWIVRALEFYRTEYRKESHIILECWSKKSDKVIDRTRTAWPLCHDSRNLGVQSSGSAVGIRFPLAELTKVPVGVIL